MIELKDFLNELNYLDKYVYNGVFYDKNYEKDNFKFTLCYKVAENLKKMNTPKMFAAINLLKIVPASYVEIILDIAEKLNPTNKNYYYTIRENLVQIYVERFKNLVKNEDVGLLICEKQKHKKKLLNLQERVMDNLERVDIIMALDYDVFELMGKYDGKDKNKKVLSDLCKHLMHSRYKKLELLKDEIFEPMMNKVLNDIEQIDEKISLI